MKIKEDEEFLNSYYETSITLISLPEIDITNKENYTQVSFVSRDTYILNTIFAKNTVIKKKVAA